MTAPHPYEEEPLLSSPRPTKTLPHKTLFPQATEPRTIIILLFTIIFILSFGGHLMGVPALRIYEDIICHHYYEEIGTDPNIKFQGDIDEKFCKGDEVQDRLNVLLGVLHFLGAIPGIITTVPYGLLADRIGRRPVFLLSVFGMVISGIYSLSIMYFWRTLPIRLVWLAPLFVLIGGGESVTGMMFYAIGNDITTDANRANVFLFGASAVFLSELIAPSLTAALMAKTPWIPLLSGLIVIALGSLPAFFISETLTLRRSEEETTATELDLDSEAVPPQSKSGSFFSLLKTQVTHALKRVRDSTGVLHSLPVLILLVPFMTGPFGHYSMELSLRYISKRFSWKLSQTNLLLTLRAIVNIILLLAILPGTSHFLTKRLHFTSNDKDSFLARVSAVILVVGSLLMAFSQNISLTIIGLALTTLGTGFGSLVRSLITTLVDKDHVGRLYAAIAIVETSTSLIAGPAVAGMYSLALKLSGRWIGLPFVGLAIIFSLGGLAVWIFGFLKTEQDRNEDGDWLVENALILEGDTHHGDFLDVI